MKSGTLNKFLVVASCWLLAGAAPRALEMFEVAPEHEWVFTVDSLVLVGWTLGMLLKLAAAVEQIEDRDC